MNNKAWLKLHEAYTQLETINIELLSALIASYNVLGLHGLLNEPLVGGEIVGKMAERAIRKAKGE